MAKHNHILLLILTTIGIGGVIVYERMSKNEKEELKNKLVNTGDEFKEDFFSFVKDFDHLISQENILLKDKLRDLKEEYTNFQSNYRNNHNNNNDSKDFRPRKSSSNSDLKVYDISRNKKIERNNVNFSANDDLGDIEKHRGDFIEPPKHED